MDEIKPNDLRVRFARNVEQMRDTINLMQPSRERALVLTKLEEAELWASKALPPAESVQPSGATDDPMSRSA